MIVGLREVKPESSALKGMSSSSLSACVTEVTSVSQIPSTMSVSGARWMTSSCIMSEGMGLSTPSHIHSNSFESSGGRDGLPGSWAASSSWCQGS
eukprot:2494538-Rhodomonas_salina.1